MSIRQPSRPNTAAQTPPTHITLPMSTRPRLSSDACRMGPNGPAAAIGTQASHSRSGLASTAFSTLDSPIVRPTMHTYGAATTTWFNRALPLPDLLRLPVSELLPSNTPPLLVAAQARPPASASPASHFTSGAAYSVPANRPSQASAASRMM